MIVCVVDTGMPAADVKNSVTAAADSAAIPPAGCSRVIFEPIVLHDPPPAEQRAEPDRRVGRQHDPQRHVRTSGGYVAAAAISRARMMPIVFWASLPPWPRLNAAADTSWPLPEPPVEPSTLATPVRTIHSTAIMKISPSARPINGDSTMNTPILRSPTGSSTPKPAMATAAPAMPPTSACDELVGRPR